MNEQLRIQIDYDGSGWEPWEAAANLSEALQTIGLAREDGSSVRCMSGYRVIDRKGRAVLVLAPINMRVVGARLRSTGEDPETSTV